MTDQALYILTFKDESLIKVGYSVDIYRRAKEMAAFERFNLQASYMVSAKNRHWICYLELILKEQFQGERGVPRNPLRGGLTSEIFNASVLPKLLHAIEVFKKVCPGAHYEIKRDLSTYQPVISRQQRKAINAQKRQEKINQWIDQREKLIAEGRFFGYSSLEAELPLV